MSVSTSLGCFFFFTVAAGLFKGERLSWKALGVVYCKCLISLRNCYPIVWKQEISTCNHCIL